MHILEFIQDLAIVMIIAGVVTIIFHRLKQPVVLGYIIAGMIIGPYTPPFSLIHDEATINTLAELGIVFLLFSLGLEFSFRKLISVGSTALIAALSEIILMIWLGFQIGGFFGWGFMNSLFLGAILSVSSTTIIIKTLDDLNMKHELFARQIFGILIFEDILAIGMIALLSAVGTTGSISVDAIFFTVGKLAVFMVVSLVLGILLVPRLLDYVARFESREMLLITVLALCFGFCLLVLKMNYSIALGAFIIGAIISESKQIHTIEQMIEPIRDMFSAIFFVAIGLLLDPRILVDYALPVIVITFCVVIGKLVSCGFGTFISGNDGRTSMRVGMGLSQIGEFSFIIASLGSALKVTSDFIYPITVAVSAVTTLLTPYLIKLADPVSLRLSRALPYPVSRLFHLYTGWLQKFRSEGRNSAVKGIIRRIIFHILINLTIIAALFLVSAYFADKILSFFAIIVGDHQIQRAILWGCILIIALPFLIAIYRKLRGLSLVIAELAGKPDKTSPGNEKAVSSIYEIINVFSIIGILLVIFFLSSGILPRIQLLILVLLLVSIIAGLFWKRFIKIHSMLQKSLTETLDNGKKE
ncbi:MAG: cation:proton antiporter [Ignavibacteria bacterium]|nr:cation:proton antiporter [Ignavibacteria bacterium]MCU7502931.1 cation:proton antiporter [Ignavibacteria bacterium]MCU7515575.1 cation:proton antiporter [Ignavibacteria bacterium]